MPIDLVIDERDGTKPPSEGGHTGNGDASRSLDSASHTDGASTPDVVSLNLFTFSLHALYPYLPQIIISNSVNTLVRSVWGN